MMGGEGADLPNPHWPPAQVRCVPYMGPGDYDDVLAAHAAASLVSARHARIRATLSNISTAGRKRMRRNLLDHEGKVDRKAVLSVLGSYAFNYNTVESTLLFSAIMVCLMGLMYTAQASGSAYYAQAQNVITAVLMLNIVGTIVYFSASPVQECMHACCLPPPPPAPPPAVTVLLVEVFLMYTEAQRAREMAAALKSGGKRSRTSSGGLLSSGAPSPRSVSESAAVAGPTDSSVNPMFLTPGGGGSATNPLLAGGQAAREAVLALTSPPPPELWSVFQSQFVSFSEQVRRHSRSSSAADEAYLYPLAPPPPPLPSGGVAGRPAGCVQARGGTRRRWRRRRRPRAGCLPLAHGPLPAVLPRQDPVRAGVCEPERCSPWGGRSSSLRSDAPQQRQLYSPGERQHHAAAEREWQQQHRPGSAPRRWQRRLRPGGAPGATQPLRERPRSRAECVGGGIAWHYRDAACRPRAGRRFGSSLCFSQPDGKEPLSTAVAGSPSTEHCHAPGGPLLCTSPDLCFISSSVFARARIDAPAL